MKPIPFFLGLMTAVLSDGCATTPARQPSDAAAAERAAILDARAAWNAGIAARDAAAYSAPWAPDMQFTSGGMHAVGRDSLARSTAGLLQERPDLVFTLHPARVTVNVAWDVASEEGDWLERWREPSGMTELRGPYFALWSRQDGRWQIVAEILHPATCRGSDYCK